MRHFKADSMNEIYYYLLHEVNHNPGKTGGIKMFSHILDPGYKEKFCMSFELTNPLNNKITYKLPKPVDYEYANCFWDFVLSGETYYHPDFVKKYPHIKMFLDSGELPKTFSAAYGPKIKRQLTKVIELLQKEPNTRWAVINILLEEDKIIWDHKTSMEYPCCCLMQFSINAEDKLCLTINMRSQNLYAVLPYDIFLYTSLLKVVAEALEKEVGSFYHVMNSAHFFGKNQEGVNQTLENYKKQGRGINLSKSIDSLIDWISFCSSQKYNKSKIDPKEIILNDITGIGFNIGNANKYLSRYISNKGEKIKNSNDLLKALHYILFEHSRIK